MQPTPTGGARRRRCSWPRLSMDTAFSGSNLHTTSVSRIDHSTMTECEQTGCEGAVPMLLLQAQKGAELGLEQVAVHFANQSYIEHDRRNAIDIRLGQRPFVVSEPRVSPGVPPRR